MTSPWTAQNCGGCPPFTDHPCGSRLDSGATVTTTSASFTAEEGNPPHSITPTGAVSLVAAPGSIDLEYHADHILLTAGYTYNREDAVYTFEIAPLATIDPDECQIRGHIAVRLDWTLANPTSSAAQVILNGRLRFELRSAGFTVTGFDLAHNRQINATGTTWHPVVETIAGLLVYSGGDHTIPSFPLSEGNFVIDRSVSRGTTQFWLDGNLLDTIADGAPAVAGALTFVLSTADARVQTVAIPNLTMVDSELVLSGLRVCPSGSAIADVAPFRHQSVLSEYLGVGDGSRTVWTTDFPYVPGSLAIEVAGILSEADNTVPSTGVFTLHDPAPVGARVMAYYRAAGG